MPAYATAFANVLDGELSVEAAFTPLFTIYYHYLLSEFDLMGDFLADAAAPESLYPIMKAFAAEVYTDYHIARLNAHLNGPEEFATANTVLLEAAAVDLGMPLEAIAEPLFAVTDNQPYDFLTPRERAAFNDAPIIIDFISALAVVDIADIPRDSMRCAHCWCDYDEEGLEVDATPVKTPCGHIYMRGCLLEALAGASMPVLRPVCRQDMVALQTASEAGHTST